MIFHFNAAKNFVAEHVKVILNRLDSNMKGIFTCFSTLRSLKKLVAELYEGNFDMNFLVMSPQILIAEHYERDFNMIFNVKAAQNFAAEPYGIDFEMIFLIMAA